MAQFTYNPETLTADQLAAISAIEKFCEEQLASLQEQEDNRMQNYYDCVDDYSWGGLCSQANALARSRAQMVRDIKIEQVVRGGFILRTKKVNCLRDNNTWDIVATGTREGRYGRFFITDDGDFVSVAKKVSTYEKKGYTPVVQTVTLKQCFDGYWRNSGDIRLKTIESTVVAEEVSTEIYY